VRRLTAAVDLSSHPIDLDIAIPTRIAASNIQRVQETQPVDLLHKLEDLHATAPRPARSAAPTPPPTTPRSRPPPPENDRRSSGEFVEVSVERIRPRGGLPLDVLLVAFDGGLLQVVVGAVGFVWALWRA
jgi:hypothetical protein